MIRTEEFWKEIIDRYLNESVSLTQLGKEYNIDRRTLSSNLKKRGIDIINKQNILKFDETIFDILDSEEKAYWLGFIYADGYISNNDICVYKNVFELSLKVSDLNHLKKFNDFMKHEQDHVKTDNYRCRWSIMNSHLWNTLNTYGCVPNKSLKLEFPNISIFTNKDLVRHFIRGYFDGDGCLTFHKYTHVVSPAISLLGTYSFLNSIIEISNIPATFRHDKRHNDKTFSLEYNKENGIAFINWLYSNCSVYLNRKYKLYNFFKNGSRSVQEWNELWSTKNGELCDENTVVTEEIKESSVPYSVETETGLQNKMFPRVVDSPTEISGRKCTRDLHKNKKCKN